MSVNAGLLTKVKKNLIIDHKKDDSLLKGMVEAAISYTEGYQHRKAGWYETQPMSPSTERAIIMLSSHFYESRDGSSAGFYGDNAQAAQQVWRAVQDLMRMDRIWQV